MKLILCFIGTLILVCATCATADSSVDLLPGGEDQPTLGVVNVWNDAETLYVEYEPVQDWYVTMAKVTMSTISSEKGKGHGNKKTKASVNLTENPWIAEIDISNYSPGDSVNLSAHATLATDGGEAEWTFTEGELAVTSLFYYDSPESLAEFSVVVEGENLIVYFDSPWGMPFKDLRLYVGDTPIGLVVPELYPYQHLGMDYVLADQFVIPLAELGITGEANLYIAAEGIIGFPVIRADGSYEYMDVSIYTKDETLVTVTGTSTPGAGDPDEQGAWAAGDTGTCKGPKGFQYVIE